MKAFLSIIILSLISAIVLSSNVSAIDYGTIHCEYNYEANHFLCSDGFSWWNIPDVPSQEMIDYYEGLGMVEPIPDPDYVTWTVSNMSP